MAAAPEYTNNTTGTPTLDDITINAVGRVNALGAALKLRFVERDREIDGVLSALCCGEHGLLLSQPGEAKSQLINTLAGAIVGARVFEGECARDMKTEEILGPVSVRRLIDEDVYEHNLDGSIADCEVGVLHEVYKSPNVVFGRLLAITNERRVYNGKGFRPVPLVSFFGTSNELPDWEADADDQSGRALHDRILWRFWSKRVSESGLLRLFAALREGVDDRELPRVSLRDLEAIRRAVSGVVVPPFVDERYAKLISSVRNRDIDVSTRRAVWAYRKALRVAALLDGRAVATEDDFEVMRDILWETPDQIGAVAECVAEFGTPLVVEVRKIEDALSSAVAAAMEAYTSKKLDARTRMQKLVEGHKKAKELTEKAEGLIEAAEQTGRDSAKARSVLASIREKRRAIGSELKSVLGEGE